MRGVISSALVLAILPGSRRRPPARQAVAPPRVYVGTTQRHHEIREKDGVFDVDIRLWWAKWLGRSRGRADGRHAAQRAGDAARRAGRRPVALGAWQVKGTLRGEFPVHGFPVRRADRGGRLELPATGGELVPDLISSGMRARFQRDGLELRAAVPAAPHGETYRSDLGRSDGGRAHEGAAARLRGDATPAGVAVGLKFFLPS